jgi:FKBP-type peptidyl-prolyl cis-trans isomerase FkpA/FKBP-type peptidyl-prolyl cis-trans isomerase FklB
LIDEASEINMDELMKGIEDALSAGQPDPLPSKDTTWAKKFKINPNEMSRICNEYYCGYFAYKAKFNEVLEQKYLGANKSKSGVKETTTGLQYVLHTEGEGDIVGENDTLTVKYVGTFVDGTEFDSCDSLVFSLSKSVDDRKRPDIDGWAEGIRLMNNGAKATLYIPAKLAYGEKGRHGIEPNATLIFDVEVLDVKKYQEPMATEVAAE